VPLALGSYDHFYFARPIAADEVNWPLASYRYGGNFIEGVTHTGVDIPAKAGTTVLASGSGTVVWAGWGLFSGIPDNINDPYGMAVAIRHNFGYQGKPLYTVYAHMRAVDVALGQWVATGTPLGEVGDTGYTTGPHLHFEVRVGQNSYYATRNPELWLAPPQGWGVLAGRIMKPNGELYHQLQYYVIDKTTRQQWDARTYGPEAVRSDDYYRENTVIGDLPAGLYLVRIPLSERVVELTVEVFPGRVTYFTYREDRGFTSGAPATPVFTPPPPRPSATP
jgi:murein DD-endopeptidase MepM/ murein hydrolase activator NlpD